ncbi:hypothetical protein GCM10009001_18400 [Virgibacillus siamensis]|uniref:DUF1510 domain-containing protein n=1 Tax=Virgibacillus siamensis TaxID=480071 RepID=A0ABP3R798_9BACI
MSENDNNSRVDKFDKRRKNTKSLTIFTVFGSILLVVFIALLVFGGGDNQDMADESETNQAANDSSESNNNNDGSTSDGQKENSAGNDSNSGDENSDESSSDKDEQQTNNDEVKKQEVESSDDNVVKAYTGNWQPVGTEQTGPHTTNYNEGSQDRVEMRKAISVATDLNQDSLTMWWIERNGDQKVVVTASDANETKTYRVYMTWVNDEGWKPTKVEELKENDQKYRFE